VTEADTEQRLRPFDDDLEAETEVVAAVGASRPGRHDTRSIRSQSRASHADRSSFLTTIVGSPSVDSSWTRLNVNES